jgi:cell fate regulator YaaT (PSP1 superfamily)
MYAQQIRFDNSPKLHLLNTELIYPVDSWVVAQSRRGLELARVRGDVVEVQGRQKAGAILREATPEDLERAESLRQEAADLKWILRTKVRGRKLPVKIVALEYTLDATLLTIAYSAENRIDLGTLISDVRSHTSAKVNFSAIGPREQTQILGALGACGRETCSSSHLQDFAPVTIKMARDQQLPLNPDKLSGPCGRLLCCLQYEHGMYQELLRDFPRRGSKACQISTGVVGKVGKINPLKGTLELYTENGMLELKNEEVERMNDGGSARED